MNSEFHYMDGLKLRILFSAIIFFGIIAAQHLYTSESEKNALAQVAAYTGHSDFITETFSFDEEGTFLRCITEYIPSLKELTISND